MKKTLLTLCLVAGCTAPLTLVAQDDGRAPARYSASHRTSDRDDDRDDDRRSRRSARDVDMSEVLEVELEATRDGLEVVSRPARGSLADRMDLRSGDVILAVDGRTVRDARDVDDAIDRGRGVVVFEMYDPRNREEFELELQLDRGGRRTRVDDEPRRTVQAPRTQTLPRTMPRSTPRATTPCPTQLGGGWYTVEPCDDPCWDECYDECWDDCYDDCYDLDWRDYGRGNGRGQGGWSQIGGGRQLLIDTGDKRLEYSQGRGGRQLMIDTGDKRLEFGSGGGFFGW